jgi:hypothetical protein
MKWFVTGHWTLLFFVCIRKRGKLIVDSRLTGKPGGTPI